MGVLAKSRSTYGFLNAWCEFRQYAKELTKRGHFYKITLISIITINCIILRTQRAIPELSPTFKKLDHRLDNICFPFVMIDSCLRLYTKHSCASWLCFGVTTSVAT